MNEALKRAGLDAVPDHLAVAPSRGSAFSREEAVAALLECRDDLGRVPGFYDYLGWSRSPKVRRRPGRRPQSQSVFERLFFGGSLGALVGAGLARDDGTGAPVGTGSGRGYAYSKEQLYRAMAEIAARGGDPEHLPRSSHYDRLRQEILDEERAADLPQRAFATSHKLRKVFGLWRQVQAAYESWRREQADRAGDEDD